jgi:hypothetical protein
LGFSSVRRVVELSLVKSYHCMFFKLGLKDFLYTVNCNLT